MGSLTPDFRKSVSTMAPSPAPFLTPRPERRRPDSRGSDWNYNRSDKDKEMNVQVLLRCRPLTDDEQRVNMTSAITCNDSKREVTVSQTVGSKHVDRVFTFDKVFGPKSQQRSIYDQAISPIVAEVLEGFNCTVFAYGQTGTGKTYTMEGGMRNKGGDLPIEAGIIPRAVRQIFDTLEAQNADYSMKVTFSELYNEEITDLLAPEDQLKSTEDRLKKPISLMEDGKGLVVVRGLEEEMVYSANEIYSLLERGSARRRTADTLLNKRSSRSHSIFTITIHIKEGTVGEEELIKCGKLNLVDLAGSENIYRSGVREARAREAGEINKSLLTLGRVINALVEHSVHVPYRDSKLTRLLRDSLGGKTKTCIIATISPSAQCLEETLSTLDYAYRAKSIKNKPEANQKVTKTVLLKDLYVEIERMKQDIRAAREKNGVYMPHERFLQDEAEKKAKNERIEQLESDLNESEKKVDKFRELYLTEQDEKMNIKSELKDCKRNLEMTHKLLEDLKDKYKLALSTLKEKDTLISKLQNSENSLINCAKQLRVNLQDASQDISALFGKIDRKDKLEKENQSILLAFEVQLGKSLKDLQEIIKSSVSQQEGQLRCVEEYITTFLANKYKSNEAMEAKVKKLLEIYTTGSLDMKKVTHALKTKASSDLDEITSAMSAQTIAVENFFQNAALESKEVLSDIQNSLTEQKRMLAFSAQQHTEGLNKSLISAQVISSAAINFSNDLHRRASELMTLLEQSQAEKSLRLQNFEQTFKEEASREEKLAMDQIAAILSTLTSKRTDMVYKASRCFEESNTEESKKFLQELSNMQNLLSSEVRDLSEYAEKAKDHYMEETFSSAECVVAMENSLVECAENVERSGRQWQNAHLGTTHLAKNNLHDITSVMQTKIIETHRMHDYLSSVSSCMDAEVDSHVNDLMMATNESLVLDNGHSKEINTITLASLDQLNSMRVNHGECISHISSRSEQCIHEEYLVEQKTNVTPKKHATAVPSLESIEAMRTPVRDLDSKSKLKLDSADNKVMQDQHRNPFQDVNGVI